MDGLGLLTEAVAAGLTVRVDGDRLVIRGPKTADAVARRLLEHKPEVATALRGESPPPRPMPEPTAAGGPAATDSPEAPADALPEPTPGAFDGWVLRPDVAGGPGGGRSVGLTWCGAETATPRGPGWLWNGSTVPKPARPGKRPTVGPAVALPRGRSILDTSWASGPLAAFAAVWRGGKIGKAGWQIMASAGGVKRGIDQ